MSSRARPASAAARGAEVLREKLGVLILDYNIQMGKFSNWSKEVRLPITQEDEILIEMIASGKSKKWIKTSQRLREKGFSRSPSECRER
jgi:hypothetical protein